MCVKKNTSCAERKRWFLRPTAVLLAALCMLSATALSSAAQSVTGILQVNLYHDLDGDGQYTGADAAPAGQLRLGFSSAAGESAYITTQYVQGASGAYNAGTTSLPVGTWRIASMQMADGYRPTGVLSIASPSAPDYRTVSFAENPPIEVAQGLYTYMRIPALLADNTTGILGKVAFADSPAAGIQGVRAELLRGDGTPFNPSIATTTGSDGVYRFTRVEPGKYRVRVTAPDSGGLLQYEPAEAIGDVTALDGRENEAPAVLIKRTAWVKFMTGSVQTAFYPAVEYGSKISPPAVGGTAVAGTATTWYKDSVYTIPWNFSVDTVTQNTTLYRKKAYEPSGGGGSSGSGKGSSPSSYASRYGTRPEIKSATLSVRGSVATLNVQVDGNPEFFTYQWEVAVGNGAWSPVTDGDKPKAQYDGIKSGYSYSFRVKVTRISDGLSSVSETLTWNPVLQAEEVADLPVDDVPPPQEQGGPATGGAGANTQSRAPALTLTRSTEDYIFEGGRIELEASAEGGSWTWDTGVLSVEKDGARAVFTGLAPAKTTVSYKLDDQTVTTEIEILPAVLPATGQSLTPVYALAALGLGLLSGALWFGLRMERGRRCGRAH